MSKAERRQFDIDETRRIVGDRDGWTCRYCGAPGEHLAHVIPQDKRYVATFGAELIHHPENMVMTCSRCNYRAELDPKTQPVKARAHIDRLRRLIEGGE